MREGARFFPSFSFWLDKGTLRCSDNFWSDLLHWIVLVVKAFQRQETQFSLHRNTQQEQKSLTICWTAWIVLLLAMGTILSMVLQPSTMIGLLRQPKKREADSLGGKGGFKSLLWVPAGRGEWQIIRSTPSLLKWVAVIVLVLDMEALRVVHRCGLGTRLGTSHILCC